MKHALRTVPSVAMAALLLCAVSGYVAAEQAESPRYLATHIHTAGLVLLSGAE